MSYKDETIWDKIWNFRYSLILIPLFILGYLIGDKIAESQDSWSILPAIGPIISMVAWGVIYKYKLLK